MDELIKEQGKDPSICLESSGDNLGSLSLIERYNKYLVDRKDQDDDSDDDDDDDDDNDDEEDDNDDNDDEEDDNDDARDINFVPYKKLLRNEFAQMRRNSSLHNSSLKQQNVDNLSRRTSINFDSTKYKNTMHPDNIVNVDDNTQPTTNGTYPTSTALELSKNLKLDLATLDKLIEKLNSVQNSCENKDWKTITCTEGDIGVIAERYKEILDFIYDKAVSSFERSNSSKDLDDDDEEEEEQQEPEVDVNNDVDDEITDKNIDNINLNEHDCDDLKLLAEKIESVNKARDKYFEVEQEVREQIEQLELVERYKMESVG